MLARRARVDERGLVVEELAQCREVAERDGVRGALEHRVGVLALDGAGGAQLVVERVTRRAEAREPRGPSTGREQAPRDALARRFGEGEGEVERRARLVVA